MQPPSPASTATAETTPTGTPTSAAITSGTPTKAPLPQPPGTPVATSTMKPRPTPNRTVIAQQTQLAQVRATQTTLAIAPPRGRIVFVSDRSGPPGSGNLFIAGADGRGLQQLTTASGFEPVYSRARNLIAFASNPASVALSAISPDGGDPFPIDEQFWQNWEPTWSPTGERLAFTSSRLNRDWEIWTMPFGRPKEASPSDR